MAGYTSFNRRQSGREWREKKNGGPVAESMRLSSVKQCFDVKSLLLEINEQQLKIMIIKISHSKTCYPGQQICAFLCRLWSEFSPWFIFQTLKLLFVSEPGIFKMDHMYHLHNTYLTRTSIWILPLLCLYFCITVPYLGLQWQRNVSLPRGIKGPRARWGKDSLALNFICPTAAGKVHHAEI